MEFRYQRAWGQMATKGKGFSPKLSAPAAERLGRAQETSQALLCISRLDGGSVTGGPFL